MRGGEDVGTFGSTFWKRNAPRLAIAAPLSMAFAWGIAHAAPKATFEIRTLTPETALEAAQAALASCRKSDYQVSVAVVDRMGVAQVVLRDRFAGPHTPEVAVGKAFTAVSFRTNTVELADETQPGKPSSGIRAVPRVVAVGGGVMIDAGGSLLGAIGVSGAPTGAADDACAKAGVQAIRDDLEF
jgi:uncharacterized protein GlcG (DUF336 family)